MSSCKRLVSSFAVLLAFSLLVGTVVGQVDEAAAEAAASRARRDLAAAYAAVLEAENAGANVSSYLPGLNVAGAYLVLAELCYRDGNFSGAVYFADLVSDGVAGMEGEVAELAHAAADARGQALYWTVAGSIVGVAVVVLAGFVSWGRVRAWYVRRLLKAKPEVADVAGS